jgi:hypothetical protein
MVPSLNLVIRSLQNTLLWIGTALGTKFPNKIGTGVMYSPQDSFNKQKKECQVPKGTHKSAFFRRPFNGGAVFWAGLFGMEWGERLLTERGLTHFGVGLEF